MLSNSLTALISTVLYAVVAILVTLFFGKNLLTVYWAIILFVQLFFFCFIARLVFTPATTKTALNGQCLMNSVKAAKAEQPAPSGANYYQNFSNQPTPRPQPTYHYVAARPARPNPQPQTTRLPGYGQGTGATLGGRTATTTAQASSSRNTLDAPRAYNPYDWLEHNTIPQSRPLKDWVSVLGAQRKMAHILDTIEQHSLWSDYRFLMNTSYSDKVQNRYQGSASAQLALDRLNETLELISKYVQFILPTKLAQIGRVAGTPLIKDLDWLQTGIEVEMAGRQMIVEGLDEELLIYGLPFFLLRNNTIRSIWFWKDTAGTQCAFMSPEVDFPRDQRTRVVDVWKRARAERNPRPRNEHRNLQRPNRPGTAMPRNRATSANNNDNNGNRPSIPTTMPAVPSSATTQGIEDLSCPICYEDYNADDSKPLNLVPCGHSVCSTCRPRIHQCPTCRSSITGSSVAFTVLGVLEALSKENAELAALRALKETQERELKELKQREEKLKAELKAAKTAPKVETPVVESKEGGRPGRQNEQPRDLSNNQNKIFIDQLPNEFTVKGVIEVLFNGEKDLMRHESGRPDVSLRQAGDHQTCVANFTSMEAAERVISKWNGMLMDNCKNLFVRKFIIANNEQPQNQKNRKKNDGNQRRNKQNNQNNQNNPSTSRQGQNGQNLAAGKKNGNSNGDTTTTDAEKKRCRLRLTKIPHGIDEDFIRLLFHGKLIDGVYCEIGIDRGKLLIDFVPATKETSCDGRCIITMGTPEAAKKIQTKFCNWTIPGSNNKLGVAYWP
ncbi:unnamed protein product, partial [Mesorhabditis belari]|uniref:RING-type domain-containing protein n=1 Tax=Mesorhabditis belari TaxID=2138241 RepID=A0AAF3J440_9BILA